MGFIRMCNDAVIGVRGSSLPPPDPSHVVGRIVEMLRQMGSWVDDIPPIDEPMRFGNKAFRWATFNWTHIIIESRVFAPVTFTCFGKKYRYFSLPSHFVRSWGMAGHDSLVVYFVSYVRPPRLRLVVSISWHFSCHPQTQHLRYNNDLLSKLEGKRDDL